MSSRRHASHSPSFAGTGPGTRGTPCGHVSAVSAVAPPLPPASRARAPSAFSGAVFCAAGFFPHRAHLRRTFPCGHAPWHATQSTRTAPCGHGRHCAHLRVMRPCGHPTHFTQSFFSRRCGHGRHFEHSASIFPCGHPEQRRHRCRLFSPCAQGLPLEYPPVPGAAPARAARHRAQPFLALPCSHGQSPLHMVQHFKMHVNLVPIRQQRRLHEKVHHSSGRHVYRKMRH